MQKAPQMRGLLFVAGNRYVLSPSTRLALTATLRNRYYSVNIIISGTQSMKRVALFVCFLAVAGCQSAAPKATGIDGADPAARALDEAAIRIARAAEQSALAQSVAGKGGRVTEEYRIDLARVPEEMRKPLLLEGGFNGELEVFLKSLTDAVGWGSPIVLGMRPATPLMVTFTEQRRPPIYWAADAGYQAGALADVTVNSSLRQIIIRYQEAGGMR